MLYEVTVNTELVNSEPNAPRGNARLSSCEPLVTTFSSADQYATLFYMSFCLKTPYLVHIVDLVALTSQPTAL